MFEKKPFKKTADPSLTNGDDTQDSCLLPLSPPPPRRHLRPPIPCTIGTSSTFYPNFFLIIVPPKPPPPPPLKAIKSAPSRAIEADTKALFFLPPGRGRACHTITYCYARMKKNLTPSITLSSANSR